MEDYPESELTETIIKRAIKIHQDLGPGLLESVYESFLEKGLRKDGLKVERQKVFNLEYEGELIEQVFRLDLLVAGKIIIELKSSEKMESVYVKQVLTYLKLTGIKLGIILNFGMSTMKEGIKRIINSSSAPQPLSVSAGNWFKV